MKFSGVDSPTLTMGSGRLVELDNLAPRNHPSVRITCDDGHA